MKKLTILRHSKKGTGDNSQFISQEGFKHAEENLHKLFPNGYPKHLFHGPEIRTLQTLQSVNNPSKTVNLIHEIGGNSFFTKWVKDGGLDFSKATPDLAGWMKANLPKDMYEGDVAFFKSGIEKMFDLIPENDEGLAIGHGGVLEPTCNKFVKTDFPFKEMEGVIFMQDENKNIVLLEFLVNKC